MAKTKSSEGSLTWGIPDIARVILSFALQIVAIILLTGQFVYRWLAFANVESSRFYVIMLLIIAAIGTMLHSKQVSKGVVIGVITLIIEILGILIVGGVGMYDAGSQITLDGSLYATLDVISGGNAVIGVLSGLVGVVINLIPYTVLMMGIIGILLSDNPDEMQTPIIEFAVSLGLMAVFYLFGNWLNFSKPKSIGELN